MLNNLLVFTHSFTSYGYNMESGKTPIAVNYEKKLNEFRARRRRQELIDNAKSSLNKIVSFMEPNSNPKRNATEETNEECQSLNLDEQRRNREDILLSEELSDNFDYVDITSETSCDSLESVDSDFSTCWNWGKVALYGTLWLSLFGLAVYAEFGFVFIILSGFVFIWFNTRTGPKRRGEISAYSVFNPDCAPIDGTLDARQFENEIRGGMGF